MNRVEAPGQRLLMKMSPEKIKNRARVFCAAIGLASLAVGLMSGLSGCATTARSAAPVATEPGFAALVVEVAAVPKKGVKAPKLGGPAGGGYGEMEDGDESGKAFERVDYARLEGVVVWAQPKDGQKFVPIADAGIKKGAGLTTDVELNFDGKARRTPPTVGPWAVGWGRSRRWRWAWARDW